MTIAEFKGFDPKNPPAVLPDAYSWSQAFEVKGRASQRPCPHCDQPVKAGQYGRKLIGKPGGEICYHDDCTPALDFTVRARRGYLPRPIPSPSQSQDLNPICVRCGGQTKRLRNGLFSCLQKRGACGIRWRNRDETLERFTATRSMHGGFEHPAFSPTAIIGDNEVLEICRPPNSRPEELIRLSPTPA